MQWIQASGGEVGGSWQVSTLVTAGRGLEHTQPGGLALAGQFKMAVLEGLRGTAVTKDIFKGGTLALVPQSTLYVASSNPNDSLMVRLCRCSMHLQQQQTRNNL